MITFKQWFTSKNKCEPEEYVTRRIYVPTMDKLHDLQKVVYDPLGIYDFSTYFMKSVLRSVADKLIADIYGSDARRNLKELGYNIDKYNTYKAEIAHFCNQDPERLLVIAYINKLLTPIINSSFQRLYNSQDKPCNISKCCTGFGDYELYCITHDNIYGTDFTNRYLELFDKIHLDKEMTFRDKLNLLEILICNMIDEYAVFQEQ